ncbi:MAG: Skp family chaperone for outer membrane protein [Paracoccaceae bacterium]|jgi:Skp family chaperone for outer membrane proteins
MLRAALFALAMIAACPPIVQAQDGPSPVGIVTIDIDRLFAATQLGQRISEDFRAESEVLAAENRTIAAALTEEERSLTERRGEMDAAVFRGEAEAFDEKVQGIRAAQDSKQRALEESTSLGREDFFVSIRPILGQLMIDNGAGAILDRRSVVMSVGRIDITDAAIAAIDEQVGDGIEIPETPTPAPDSLLDPIAAPATGEDGADTTGAN